MELPPPAAGPPSPTPAQEPQQQSPSQQQSQSQESGHGPPPGLQLAPQQSPQEVPLQPPPVPHYRQHPDLARGPQFPGPPAPVRRLAPRPLRLRARADRRLIAVAAAGGVAFDIAANSGVATIGVTTLIVVTAAALLLSRRVRGRAAGILIGAAPALGLIVTLRSSPWVIAPTIVGVVLLLCIGTSLGADAGGLSLTFPEAAGRLALVVGHLVNAPGMFQFTGQDEAGQATRKRAAAIGRGALLGVPIMLLVGLLLALADPIFRSWFDLTPLIKHLVLALIGAWLVAGLGRAASAEQPSADMPAAPTLGTVEASFVLGGLCALYATFAGSQVVALSGAGHRILVTQGLTYAQYARSGFFELLACAAITLLILLGVRAFANRDHPVLIALSWLTVVLTVAVVVVAIRRLQLYESAYGLTMLRLACLVAAAWIGLVFVLLGATLLPRGLPRRWFPAAILISGLVFTAAWGLGDPALIVATTNLRRAENGHSFDVHQAATLGPDAVPALLAGLHDLRRADAYELRRALCSRSPGKHDGSAYNLARARASEAIASACGATGPVTSLTPLTAPASTGYVADQGEHGEQPRGGSATWTRSR